MNLNRMFAPISVFPVVPSAFLPAGLLLSSKHDTLNQKHINVSGGIPFMMAALVDRKQLKADAKSRLATAQVSPKAITALYLGIVLALDLISTIVGDKGMASTFISILVVLLAMVLKAGFTLYCMDIRQNGESGYLTLFDGFSLVGKIIGLEIVMLVFTALWSMLFVIPGIIAMYRYRFAMFNLLENPDLGIFEALNLSKQQTTGYKVQLLMLDLSYIGWMILGDLPATAYSSYIQVDAVRSAMSFAALEGLQPAIAAPEFLPFWGWILLTGIWNLVVALFYLPHRTCVELGYFQIAKETSGAGSRPFGRNSFGDDTEDPDRFN